MAPIPADCGALSTIVHVTVGDSRSALSWPTILAFMSILVAGMQGTLVMESADPCRISYRKVCILLVLEIAEVIVIAASEVLSFVQLQRALTMRLEWLHFLPPCILVIGVLEIFLDVYCTLISAMKCRLDWTPFSASGRNADGSKRRHWEILWLVVTAVCSFVLVGWRQRWWWVSEAVSENIARRTGADNTALSTGVMGFCVAWGLIISGGSVGLLYLNLDKGDYESFLSLLRPILFMETRLADETRSSSSILAPLNREPTEDLRSQQRFLNRYRHGQNIGDHENMDDDELDCQLEFAPLHVGNAVVGEDKDAVYEEDDVGMAFTHVFFLLVEHLAIMPLLLSVLIAVAQLWNKMDMQTFNAMKELADVVIVVAFVEIAIGVKSLLWGVNGRGDEEEDVLLSDDSRWIQKVINERRGSNQLDGANGRREEGLHDL